MSCWECSQSRWTGSARSVMPTLHPVVRAAALCGCLPVQHYYTEKESPPLAINMPPLSGKMCWARQLGFHLEKPMKRFQAHPALLDSGPGHLLVRKYNQIAVALTEYEILHYKAWVQLVEQAQHCLHVSLHSSLYICLHVSLHGSLYVCI